VLVYYMFMEHLFMELRTEEPVIMLMEHLVFSLLYVTSCAELRMLFDNFGHLQWT
jgi:hypothetical protein